MDSRARLQKSEITNSLKTFLNGNYLRLGLTPDEEIDYAYLTYNLGLDVFYLGNQIYTARQVVTK
jgi:hypothetical protein